MKRNCQRTSSMKSCILLVFALLINDCFGKDATIASDIYEDEVTTVNPIIVSILKENNQSIINDSLALFNFSNLQKSNEITLNPDILKIFESTTQVNLNEELQFPAVLSKDNKTHNNDKELINGLLSKLSKINSSEHSHRNESLVKPNSEQPVINLKLNEIAEATKSENIPGTDNKFHHRLGQADESHLQVNVGVVGENGKKLPVFHAPSVTTTKSHLLSLDEMSDSHLDSWRPVWPFPNIAPVPIKPTVRFPSITGPFTKIDPTPTFGSKHSETYSITKEPVTAYYFDLSSAVPAPPAGPLHDSEGFINDDYLHAPSGNNVKELSNPVFNHEDLSRLESSLDDYFQNSNIKLPDPISSTPLMNIAGETFNEASLGNTKNSSLYSINPTTNVSRVVPSSSVNNHASSKLHNSSIEYTLGNANDFLFDQEISNENNNNVSPVSHTNLTAAKHHAKIDVTSGDILGISAESAFNASLASSVHVINSSAFVPDISKDDEDLLSDTLSLSRIPLWQRISHKTATVLASPTVVYDNTLSSAPSHLPSYSASDIKFPFENDIPIGILSPGIFKSNNHFSVVSTDDNFDNEQSIENTTKDVSIDFPSPTLESSLHSSTQPQKTTYNNYDKTADTAKGSDSLLHASDSKAKASEAIAHTANSNVIPTVVKSLLNANDPHNSLVDNSTHSQSSPQFTKDSTSPQPVAKDKTINTVPDFIPETTIEPTHLDPVSLDLNTSNESELSKDPNLGTPGLVLNKHASSANDSDSVTVSHNVNLFPEEPHLLFTEKDSSFGFKNSTSLAEGNAYEKSPPFEFSNVTDKSHVSVPSVREGVSDKKNESANTEVTTFLNTSIMPNTDQNDTGILENDQNITTVRNDISSDNKSFTMSSTSASTIPSTSTSQIPSNSTSQIPSTSTSRTPSTSTSQIPSTSTAPNPSTSPIPLTSATFDLTTSGPPTSSSTSVRSTPPSTTETISLVTLPEADSVDSLISQPPNRSEITPEDEDNTTNSSEASIPHPEEKVIVVLGKDDDEPQLHLIKVNKDGTNTTHPSPFVKAAVSYDISQFCKHRRNIYALLVEWINKHMTNKTKVKPYEIEVFYQPECKDVYFPDNETLQNRTDVYFYVKENGQISPNLTLKFPKNPTELAISNELNYLKRKILHLELVNAVPSQEDLLIEEAAVGTSLVVAVVITSLLIVLLVASVLVFILIRRKRAAENLHGRRCTPAANDAYSLDSVSVFYHSIRRKSRKRASNKSLKSYLNQGFEDPNGPSRPLNFVKLTHCISDMEGIYDEFSNIPAIIPKYDEIPRGVEDKNRYANVIPVSETRILLNNNSPKDEYINANSVHGPKGELRYYIATQAPLDETVADFWQMVWEQESKVIVMLTDFVEKGIDKCADYLPPSETLDCHRVYGEFQITLKSRDLREKYIVSVVQIKNLENNLVREIAHMWFNGWPHSGVPNEEKYFISFIFDVRTTRKQLRAKGPIIVHCSPGTGRTGTYIACDLVMKQFDENKVVDIPKTVYRIRRERSGAVQTKEQYAFIYRVVNLYAAKLTTGNLDSF